MEVWPQDDGDLTYFEKWGFKRTPFDPLPLTATAEDSALLVGRKHELQQLKNVLRNGRRIAVIDGMTGVGKTSLANVCVYRCWERFQQRSSSMLLIPCDEIFQLDHETTVEGFTQRVLMAVAQTLVAQRSRLEASGRSTSALGELDRWLNSAEMESWGGGFSVFGFGGNVNKSTTLNPGPGFALAGFRRMVLQALVEAFRGDEGVVCVIDNMELLDTCQQAREVVESLRDVLLHLVGLRWILAGAGGITGALRTAQRLDGYLASPIIVGGIDDEEVPEILASRLRAFAREPDCEPYLPLMRKNFVDLYHVLAKNLRSALARADDYCAWVSERPAPRTEPEKREYYHTWLDEESDRRLTRCQRDMTPRAWKVFDYAASEMGGHFTPGDYAEFGFKSVQSLSPHVQRMKKVELIQEKTDDSDSRRKSLEISADGRLVAYARARDHPQSGDLKMAVMSDFSVVWLNKPKGPCVLCGAETGVGAVGWRHQGDPISPVCDNCMRDREETLGGLLRMARAQGNGATN